MAPHTSIREEAQAAEKAVLHLISALPESTHKTPHIEPHPYSQTRQDLKEPQTVTVNPGDPIDKLVNRAPAGTTFIFVPGLHRIQRIQPKDGQSFIGMNGAIMSGARNSMDLPERGLAGCSRPA